MLKITRRKQLKDVQRERSKRENTLMVMRCSELYGNIERLAEMTNPPRNRSTSNRSDETSL